MDTTSDPILYDLQGKFGNQQTEVKTFVDSAAEDSCDDTIYRYSFLVRSISWKD